MFYSQTYSIGKFLFCSYKIIYVIKRLVENKNISEDVTFLEFNRLTVLQYKSCTLYGIDKTYKVPIWTGAKSMLGIRGKEYQTATKRDRRRQ